MAELRIERTVFDSFCRHLNSFRKRVEDQLIIESLLCRELLAEFVATTFFMSVGFCCSLSSRFSHGTAGNVVTEDLGWAMALTFAITIAGGVSGGHVNPSISLALALIGHLPWFKVPLYALAQICGTFVGAAISYGVYYEAFQAYDGGVRSILGVNGTGNLYATYPQAFLSNGGGLATEIYATCVLMFSVMAINDKNNMAVPLFLMPLFCGLAFFMLLCSVCYNSGCAMNPARDFGPRLFTLVAGWTNEVFSFRNYTWFWVPIVGPLIGAPLGAVLYKLLIGIHFSTQTPPQSPKEKAGLRIQHHMTQSTDCDPELDHPDINGSTERFSRIEPKSSIVPLE